MSDSPKKHRSSKKQNKTEKKTSSTSSSTYVTPFTFDKSRIDVIKADKKEGKTKEGTPYSHYEIEVKYRYPNGTLGKLLCKFKGAQIRNFICKDEIKEFLIEKKDSDSDKKKPKHKSVKLEKMVAGIVFDPNLTEETMPRYKYDPEITDTTETISQAEITEQSFKFYNDLVLAISEKLAEKGSVPWYDDKDVSVISGLGSGSKPDHPKDKNTEKAILTRPKQIYYDVKSYAFVNKDTNEIKKVKGKFKSITGSELSWSEVQDQIIDGDIFVEFNRCTAKKTGWSIKGNIDPVIVTDMTEKVNYSEQVSKEALAEYRFDEAALSKMAQREQKLREKMQEMRLKNQEVKEKESSSPKKKSKPKKDESDEDSSPKKKSKKADSDDDSSPKKKSKSKKADSDEDSSPKKKKKSKPKKVESDEDSSPKKKSKKVVEDEKDNDDDDDGEDDDIANILAQK